MFLEGENFFKMLGVVCSLVGYLSSFAEWSYVPSYPIKIF